MQKTLFVFLAVTMCAFAHFGGEGASLTDEQKAEIKSKIQAKLATLSADAQTAGNEILTAIEANQGDKEAIRTAVEQILSTVSDSIKEELKSILPKFGNFPGNQFGQRATRATRASLTDEQKAEIKAKIQEKLATLSADAQTAGNQILAAIEANQGDKEAIRTAVEQILSTASDSIKQELKSILPKFGNFPGDQFGQRATRAARASLTDEQKAEIKTKIQEKLATLSADAQTAGNQILSAIETNQGDKEAIRTAVEQILSTVSESIKQELKSILPKFGNFPGHQFGQRATRAARASLTDEQKAEIKTKIQEKLATLSADAQTAGNQILTAIETNQGNKEAIRTAVEQILSTVSDSIKQELKSILPKFGNGHEFGQRATRAARASLTDEQKADIKAKIQVKLATLSADAQTVGNQILTAIEANQGDKEAIRTAVEKILSTVSDTVKQELKSILPRGGIFSGHESA